ncbi:MULTISPECIES: hypothetical protein [Sporosarcina]|uniref:Uncharacterized protein n=1 Tax=Sporosarcina contaminans TaxID=633403 RepID=A0ABW3U0B5_9BACL
MYFTDREVVQRHMQDIQQEVNEYRMERKAKNNSKRTKSSFRALLSYWFL